MGNDKKIKYLTAYVAFSSLLFIGLLFSSFTKKDNKISFDEITVKRINLISEEGELRLVLSNETRQHPGRMNGKDFEKRERPAGILFFNTEGDECGGITYYGKTENGTTHSGFSLTTDQYKEDQVIQILNGESHSDGKSQIVRGISISDLPTGSDLITRMNTINKIKSIPDETERNKKIAEVGNSLGSKQRLFIGRTRQNSSGLFLAGPDGKHKIKIYVDEKGNAKFEVVDEKGNSKNILD